MKEARGFKRILGVDPGTVSTGYGVVEDRGGNLHCLESGVIRTQVKSAATKTAQPAFAVRRQLSETSWATDSRNINTLPGRLELLFEKLNVVIQQHKPQVMAVETLFHAQNSQSALKLGHARGVILLCAALQGLHFFEYSPREIKKGIAGNGNAGKDQVRRMVQLLLQSSAGKIGNSLDTSDALAVALYHSHLNPTYRDHTKGAHP